MSPASAPAPAAACAAAAALLATLAIARAEIQSGSYSHNNRATRVLGVPELPHGCMYEGRWFTEGSAVVTREACLRCACGRGALSCRRRACAALPDPPPRRCHVLHKRDACCPELHCPDGVKLMEHGASARFENDDFADIVTPASIMHACVEGGTVFTAGSALGARVACEQCFCLGGARRCVRPRCLPPPPGCRARPAPGACCPQRYYCDHVSTKPPDRKHVHDCQVNGQRIVEGERVVAAERTANCTQCFCLRGAVRCQPLTCAPPLLGCRPLLRPGQCCPHQYHCDHGQHDLVTPNIVPISDNGLSSTRYDDRSLHTDKLVEQETTTNIMTTSTITARNTPATAATDKEPITTTKVKRKTNDPPPASTSIKPMLNATTVTMTTTKKDETTTTMKIDVTSTESFTTTETHEKAMPTEQHEGTVKIMINGTINCTAELSSTSIPLNISLNDTDKIKIEGHLRTPINKVDIEAYTEYPNDIITDRSANEDFDENETFTINVTSSLITNSSHSTPGPYLSTTPKVAIPIDVVDTVNTSKKTKGDYDYDYTEPTLPPSLPNLKIIPFVAADAVVDDDITSKGETLTYSILEREDKYPVYYPAVDTKDIPYATRREDLYPPTKYPVFVSGKAELPKYPSLTHEMDLSDLATAHNNLVVPQHNFTSPVTAMSPVIESNMVNKSVTKSLTTSSTFSMQAPSVNLFSPPVETEGGFIPKGPGIIDEYYAVYPSTPPGPPVSHLTTSMQLDIKKGECVSSDGRHVLEGDSVSLACSVCSCAWGELHCAPRPCPAPPGCRHRPAATSSADLCCGELVCQGNKTTSQSNLLINIMTNETKSLKRNNTSNHSVYQPSSKNNTQENKSLPEKIHNFDSDNNNWNISIVNVNMSTVNFKQPTSTETLLTTPSSTVVTTQISSNDSETEIKSQEYEDEEEEDEGFSFGSVLKLLLSDNYETSTNSPYKRRPTTFIPKTSNSTKTSTTAPPTTTKTLPPKPPVVPFIPMPHSYIPPKKSYTQNTVNRIDHLVLGEATAIKMTTPRPIATQFKPIVSYKPVTKHTTTHRPYVTTRVTEATRKEEAVVNRVPAMHDVWPASSAHDVQPAFIAHQIRPASTAHDVWPSSSKQEIRPASSTQEVQPASSTQDVQPAFNGHDIRPPSSMHDVRPSFNAHDNRPNASVSDIRTPASAQEIQPAFIAHDVRPSSSVLAAWPPSSTQEVQPPSRTQEVRPAPSMQEVRPAFTNAHDVRPASSALPLPGILKLAGCNIYGRMYRVGRIITELSTPCQECWCTELGVQCNSLKC